MRNFTTTLLVALFAVLFTANIASAMNNWDSLGANPTTISMVETLKKTDLEPVHIDFIRNNYPETTLVVGGMIFNQVSSGDGVIQNNVEVNYETAKALVWHAGEVDIYYFLNCNNVAWKASCVEALGITLVVYDTTFVPFADASMVTNFSDLPDWVNWLLGLLLFLILVLLLFLRNRPSNNPPPDPTVRQSEHHRLMREAEATSFDEGHASGRNETLKAISKTHIDTENLDTHETNQLTEGFSKIGEELSERRKSATQETEAIDEVIPKPDDTQ